MKTKSDQKGASAVEFALILPLLVVILFGIIEFGLILYDQQVITNASRDGARAGIVNQTPRMGFADIKTVVDEYSKTNLITFGTAPSTILHSVENVTSGGTFTSGNTPICTAFGDRLLVTVTYPYKFLVFSSVMPLLSGGHLSSSLPLKAQTAMKCE